MDRPAELSEDEIVDLSALPWIVWVELQRDVVSFEYRDGIEDALSDAYPEFAARWKDVQSIGPNVTFERAFFTLSPGELAELVERQSSAEGRRGESTVAPVALEELFAHHLLRVPSEEQAIEVAKALQGLEHIFARVQVQAPLPPQPASSQHYLDGVDLVNDTAGINVRSVWTSAGGKGENVMIGVIEQCWALAHRDLPAAIAPRRYPQVQSANDLNMQRAIVHAMADAGILAAMHNNIHFDGIVAGAAIRLTSSIRTKNGVKLYDVADAIASLAQQLPAGAVLLVEEQAETLVQGRLQLAPAEQIAAVHTAIRAATNINIAVIEPAGNGGIDIDGVLSAVDSGAIMIGACADDGQHPSRLAGVLPSNFGARVDCYALGEFVETLALNNGTRRDYGGTSAAAAIIAGAAASVLSIAAANGRTVTPEELRNWFRDDSQGVASANPGVDRIGVMPDVGRLVANL